MATLTNSCLSKTYEHIMNKKNLKELFVDGTKGIVASPNLNYNWLYEQLTKKIFNARSYEIICRAKVSWLSKSDSSLRPQLKAIEEIKSKRQKL